MHVVWEMTVCTSMELFNCSSRFKFDRVIDTIAVDACRNSWTTWSKKGLISQYQDFRLYNKTSPDSKVHGANMGPTRVQSAPDGPHVGPMNLAIRVHMRSRQRPTVYCDSANSSFPSHFFDRAMCIGYRDRNFPGANDYIRHKSLIHWHAI